MPSLAAGGPPGGGAAAVAAPKPEIAYKQESLRYANAGFGSLSVQFCHTYHVRLAQLRPHVLRQAQRKWVPLDSSHRSALRNGLRIARKQAAPDLIRLPLPAPTDARGSS